MKEIDALGLMCPKPLIMLKDALKTMHPGEEFRILTDNETSCKNLLTFLKDQGSEAEVSRTGNEYTILSRVPEKDLSDVNAESYCNPGKGSNDYVVCIRRNRMGDGDPELGRILIETFLNNLNQQELLPSHIIFYNEGVQLVKKNSPVLETLIELEKAGTRIMVCGTCIDYYGIQEEVGVGMISNMVVITEKLVETGHVVYP